MMVINSLGQKTGYDPSVGQVVQQIPNSVYVRDELEDDLTGAPPTETIHIAEISQPPQGTYQIIISGLQLAAYSLSSRIFAQDGSPEPDVIVTGIAGPGSSSSFLYSAKPRARLKFGRDCRSNLSEHVGRHR